MQDGQGLIVIGDAAVYRPLPTWPKAAIDQFGLDRRSQLPGESPREPQRGERDECPDAAEMPVQPLIAASATRRWEAGGTHTLARFSLRDQLGKSVPDWPGTPCRIRLCKNFQRVRHTFRRHDQWPMNGNVNR